MMKPDECSQCNSKDLVLHKNYEVFNPDTDLYDIVEEVYKCTRCNTIYADNKDIKFIQKEISTNKLLQLHDDCNITIN